MEVQNYEILQKSAETNVLELLKSQKSLHSQPCRGKTLSKIEPTTHFKCWFDGPDTNGIHSQIFCEDLYVSLKYQGFQSLCCFEKLLAIWKTLVNDLKIICRWEKMGRNFEKIVADSSKGITDLKNTKVLDPAQQTTIMFIIFWDFLMVEKIFLSPQVKRSVIISNKLVCTSCLTSCRTS